MRNICIFCWLALSISVVRAQSPMAKKQQSRWFAGLTAGPSFPLGKFAAKDPYDVQAGLAKTGPALQLTAGYFFHPRLGAMFLAGGQINPQDAEAYGRFIKGQYGATSRYSVHTRNWNMLRLMAGPVFELPLSPQGPVALRVKLLAGVLKTSMPGYSYTVTTYYVATGPTGSPVGGSSTSSQTFSSTSLPWAFSYQAEAGVRWRLTRQIDLVGNVGWLHAQPVRKYKLPISSMLSSGPVFTGLLMPATYVEVKQKIPISDLHIQTGVEVRF